MSGPWLVASSSHLYLSTAKQGRLIHLVVSVRLSICVFVCRRFYALSSRVDAFCPQTATRWGIYSIMQFFEGGLWHLVDVCGQKASTLQLLSCLNRLTYDLDFFMILVFPKGRYPLHVVRFCEFCKYAFVTVAVHIWCSQSHVLLSLYTFLISVNQLGALSPYSLHILNTGCCYPVAQWKKWS